MDKVLVAAVPVIRGGRLAGHNLVPIDPQDEPELLEYANELAALLRKRKEARES